MSVNQPLPVDPVRADVRDALAKEGCAILVAPPGSGKTTRVPPSLLEDARFEGAVWLLQPRRLAVRLSADRIAEEHGSPVGQTIGYRIRFERKTSAQTRLVVCTEGVLLARIQQDPLLEGIGCLVFDEFHERNVEADLSLALARRVQQDLRPDLKILVMSATLDAEPLSAWLGGAPILRAEGRPHPVEIRYHPPATESAYLDAVADALPELLAQQEGDVLVFLPGVGEIERVRRTLARRRALARLEIHALHGRMRPEAQARALAPGGPRRIILATNVAETSLTLPRVDAVIDAGRVRVQRFDPRSGLESLVTERAPRSSLDQRAGRAGRVRPGLCVRTFHEAHARHAAPEPTPAITRVDAARVVLQLRAWGERQVLDFPFVTPPPRASIERALELLVRLEAIPSPAPGGVTSHGRLMARLPLSPRLARLVVEGAQRGVLDLACTIAALLEDGDLLRRDRRAAPVPCAVRDALDRLADEQAPVTKRVRRVARQVARVAGTVLGGPPSAPKEAEEAPETLGALLLAAYPDRVARRRIQDPSRAVMVGGSGLRVSPSAGAPDAALLLVLASGGAPTGSAEADRTVHAASPLEEAWLPQARVQTHIESVWDEARERPAGWRVRIYDDLVLERREAPLSKDDARAALLAKAREDLSDALGLARPEFVTLQARVAFARSGSSEAPPPVLDEAFLLPVLESLVRDHGNLAKLRGAPVAARCLDHFTYPQRKTLDRLAPTHLVVPSGSRIALTWEPNAPPILAVRIQEMFGLRETPTVGHPPVPVRLHLLAPNRRVQQITDDLGGFWTRTYPQVRKDLRGRYPKHAWPEDGSTAEPLRGAKRRRRDS